MYCLSVWKLSGSPVYKRSQIWEKAFHKFALQRFAAWTSASALFRALYDWIRQSCDMLEASNRFGRTPPSLCVHEQSSHSCSPARSGLSGARTGRSLDTNRMWCSSATMEAHFGIKNVSGVGSTPLRAPLIASAWMDLPDSCGRSQNIAKYHFIYWKPAPRKLHFATCATLSNHESQKIDGKWLDRLSYSSYQLS